MDIIEQLMIQTYKHNYSLFVKKYGYDRANKLLDMAFGDSWKEHKEMIWQWYDTDRKNTTIEIELEENELSLQQQAHQSQCDEGLL